MGKKIIISLLLKLVSEKVLSKTVIIALEYLSEKTENKVDDKLVKVVKEALGEKEEVAEV